MSELRQKILSLKNNAESRPMLKRKQKRSVILIHAFIGSFLSMIASIMNVVVHGDKIKMVDREIKIYLINLHIIQSQVDALNHKKIGTANIYWLVKYNFSSLLNIPETMEIYGPLVNLSEGSK